MATETDPKSVFRRFIEEGPNRGNLAALDGLFAPEYVQHMPGATITGPDGVKQVVAGFRAAFPDLHVEIEDLICEGEVLAARVTASGTNSGDFMGLGTSGRHATWSVAHLCRVRDGRFVEDRIHFDQLGLREQLGFA
jgi:predicted ester cyclase